jgi:hypothetical protein
MSILAVGSVAFDNITTPSGHAENVLGGAATYFGLAASYFTEMFSKSAASILAASSMQKARPFAGAENIWTT